MSSAQKRVCLSAEVHTTTKIIEDCGYAYSIPNPFICNNVSPCGPCIQPGQNCLSRVTTAFEVTAADWTAGNDVTLLPANFAPETAPLLKNTAITFYLVNQAGSKLVLRWSGTGDLYTIQVDSPAEFQADPNVRLNTCAFLLVA